MFKSVRRGVSEHSANRIVTVVLLAGLIIFAVACQQPSAPADTRQADEAAIRARSTGEWMNAMAARDIDKVMSMMSADIKAWWGGKVEANQEAVRRDVEAAFADPNYSLTWEITKLVVSRSGDLAYEMGDYKETTSDANQKPQTVTGNYVTIWEKQADGTWLATLDFGNLNQ